MSGLQEWKNLLKIAANTADEDMMHSTLSQLFDDIREMMKQPLLNEIKTITPFEKWKANNSVDKPENILQKTYNKYVEKLFNDRFFPTKEVYRKNEENITRIIDIIRAKNFGGEQWEKQWIFDESFREILFTPVILPFVCPRFLSGEYILYILHGDSIEFAGEIRPSWEASVNEKDLRDEEADYKTKADDIFFGVRESGKVNSYLGQFQRELGVNLYGFDVDDPNLRKVFEVYRYIRNTPTKSDLQKKESRKYRNQKKNNTDKRHIIQRDSYGSSLFYIMSKSALGIHEYGNLAPLNEDESRILAFRTLLYQSMSQKGKDSIELFCTSSINYMEYSFKLLENIFYSLIAIEYSNMEDEYKKIFLDIHGYIEKINNEFPSKKIYSINDNLQSAFLDVTPTSCDIAYNVLWRSIAKETLVNWKRLYDFIVKNMNPIDEIKSEAYKSMNLLSTIKKYSWKLFAKKNMDNLKIIFPSASENDLEESWEISVKLLIYMNPIAFNLYSMNNGIGVTENNEKIQGIPKAKWYRDNRIPVEEIRINEIIPMMGLVLFIGFTHGKNDIQIKAHGRSYYLSHLMKNIQNFCSPEIINIIRYLYISRSQNMIKNGKAFAFYRYLLEWYTEKVFYLETTLSESLGINMYYRGMALNWLQGFHDIVSNSIDHINILNKAKPTPKNH